VLEAPSCLLGRGRDRRGSEQNQVQGQASRSPQRPRSAVTVADTVSVSVTDTATVAVPAPGACSTHVRRPAPDDGLFLAVPHPLNPERVLYLVLANSALQLNEMTKTYHCDIPSTARFEGDEIFDRGYHQRDDFNVVFPASGG